MARADLANIEIEYRFAWWMRWYTHALLQFCLIFGTTPDFDKLQRMLVRAARWRIVGTTKWRRI